MHYRPNLSHIIVNIVLLNYSLNSSISKERLEYSLFSLSTAASCLYLHLSDLHIVCFILYVVCVRIRHITPGTGTAGAGGDGGAATSAFMNKPSGVAVDSMGDLYIADATNNRIRKVTTTGIITTIAGNKCAGYQ